MCVDLTTRLLQIQLREKEGRLPRVNVANISDSEPKFHVHPADAAKDIFREILKHLAKYSARNYEIEGKFLLFRTFHRLHVAVAG